MMDSKTSAIAPPQHHQKVSGIQAVETKDNKPCSLQAQKMGKHELAAPESSLKTVQSASKQKTGETSENKKLGIPNHKGSGDSLSSKCGSGPSGASLPVIDHASREVDHAVSESRRLQESFTDQEKKTSEYGSGKNSFVSAKVSDGASSLAKSSGIAKISDRADFVESGKSSICRGSTSSDMSDESSCSSFSSAINKPHKANDLRWEAIQAVRARDWTLGLGHFRLRKRLGCGDIGSVYISILNGTISYFAMKVMDKGSLASRKKLLCAQTEREILQSLEHPSLPTLYSHFDTQKFLCLVMEFCPGGDLYTLRQRQPGKHFPEQAVNPTLVKIASVDSDPLRKNPGYCIQPACIEPPSCIQPSCVAPTACFSPQLFSSKSKKERKPKTEIGNQVSPLPELIAEPTDAHLCHLLEHTSTWLLR